MENFIEQACTLHLTEEKIKAIQIATLNQSSNELWKNLRQGRIIASNFYRVMTKMEKKDPDCSSLVENLINLSDLSNNAAIQHGKKNEVAALKAYCEQQSAVHSGFTAEDTGIFLSKRYPYLGASPDGLTSCQCCGDCLVEVKCPVVQSSPSHENVSFLKKSTGGKSILKEKHPYYGLIQGQMAICGLHHCDLFVYSEYGSVIQRIYYNEGFSKKMFICLVKCFKKHLAEPFYRSHGTNSCSADRDLDHNVTEPCFSDIEVKRKIRSFQ